MAVAAGARIAESMLLDAVDALLSEGPSDLASLARPIRIVVPSGSLRDHVAAALVRRRGAAVLGVRVQTLLGLARDLLPDEAQGDALFSLLVQRSARREAVLREHFDSLEDGYGLVTATVADLLDAGLEPDRARALERRLAARGDARGAALVRTAAGSALALERARTLRSNQLLSRAAEALERGDRALVAGAVLVHGFADVTGRAGRLLEALLTHCGARVVLDAPPDPARPTCADWDFLAPLCFRLERVSGEGTVPAAGGSAPATELTLLQAAGEEALVRGVGRRIAACIEAGAIPEQIGVVARDLEPYDLPLRTQLARLGVPFSAHGRLGPIAPQGRQLRALVELLQRGPATPVDLWLLASPALGARHDLSLGLHALGSGRVGDVAELDLAQRLDTASSLPLPVRGGLSVREEDGTPMARHRRLPRAALERAVALARELMSRIEAWPARAAPAEHAQSLGALAREHLGWSRAETEAADAELQHLLDGLAALPDGEAVTREELATLLRAGVQQLGRESLGGAGGGVQVLEATEARARCFSHLFVLDMNRDVFPRTVTEDPLLPDAVRASLHDLLPDLPLKRRGHSEERYLFAQLVSSSPVVTLSWLTSDDEGAPRSPSPLIESLRVERPELVPERLPGPWSEPADHARPAHEHAIAAALAGDGDGLDAAVELAHRTELPVGIVQPSKVARARAAVRREQEPDARGRVRLGPYFGFVGSLGPASDPRRQPLFVTTLERYASCPWRMLVERLLRIEGPPDALDALPSLSDPRLLGSVVHAALEAIVGAGAGTLDDVAQQAGHAAAWPERAKLDSILDHAAREALLERGVELPGLTLALARLARPYVLRARELVLPADGPAVLGAELLGALEIAGQRLRFRADLVQRAGDDLLLTDFKTGAPLSTKKSADKRRDDLLRGLERGTLLQAVAYRVGGGGKSSGRYVYLRPELESDVAVVPIGPDDPEIERAFRRVAGGALEALRAGVFLPRMIDAANDEEPPACGYCEVADACLRGDSGARRRMTRFAEERGDRPRGAQAHWLALYRLGRQREDA